MTKSESVDFEPNSPHGITFLYFSTCLIEIIDLFTYTYVCMYHEKFHLLASITQM